MMKYGTVIFDMDGTILNTAGDLRVSLNYALQAAGYRSAYTEQQVRLFFGSGIAEAIRRALGTEGIVPAPEEVDRIRKIFVPYYADHCADLTDSYPGIPELLRELRASGVKTAVVSNKPDIAVQELAARYFPGLFDMAVGEKEGIRRKPDPDMTESALRRLGAGKSTAVYVGDSEVDLQTAENAGLPCISVDWGFRSVDFLRQHHAAVIVSKPQEIMKIVRGDCS
jgi:phosphoglycolate phosphatase